MLKARVIPCLDVKDGRVVKGVNFVDLIDAGDPVEAATAYDAAGADELCFLDITASSDNRETIFDVVARTAERCFMPLTVGGGVRSVGDIRKLLLAGADKVSINTAAVKDPDFVAEAADKFGNQCIVVAIDAKKVSGQGEADRWEIFTHGGRQKTGIDAVEFARQGRRPRRGRNPADLDGSRRHQGRLRYRADPRDCRRGARACHRLGRASARWTIWSKACATAMRRRCLPPRSSISEPIRSPKPRRIWPRPACRCGWTLPLQRNKRPFMREFSLAELEKIVAERGLSGDSGSWTAKLFAGGMDKAAKKLGEEAVETVIAAVGGDKKALVSESADLLYHWLVVLALAGVPLSEVIGELERRTGQSGIAEKASRAKPGHGPG